ncbi:MAG: BrnT family toxin, partial [Proteobacteria bacterium]|nr:BrnT family toxin [Pseudomonadota bacterium]
ILFVVFTWRGSVRRIISARLANRKERDIHEKTFSGAGAP